MKIGMDCKAITNSTLCSFNIKKNIRPYYIKQIKHLPTRIGYYNTVLVLYLVFNETVDILNSSSARN